MSSSHSQVRDDRVIAQKPPEPPFIYKLTIEQHYNPNYGDEKMCQCGHAYYRHFDFYEDTQLCGCKYCGCFEFKPLDTACA